MDQLSDSNSENYSERNEGTDDLTDFIPSSTDLLFETESEVVCLSAEDIASGALKRIFEENPNYPSASADNCAIRKQTGTINDFESSTGRKTQAAESRKMEHHRPRRQTCTPSVFGQNSPKVKQRSVMGRRLSPHPPLTQQGVFNMNNTSSLRKTRSIALPAIINTPWPRGGTASTPDLKVHQGMLTDPPARDNIGSRNGQVCRQRVISYYNVRLLGVILNCVILVAGLVHLGGAVALAVYRDIVLIVAKYEMCILVGASLAIVSIMLLILSMAGLCLVHDGPRRITAYAGCCLIVAATIVSLASLENSAEGEILSDAKMHMLSTIEPQKPHVAPSAWNKFHDTFKCCGVTGSWDWCYKKTDERTTNESDKNFLGVYVCMVPTSCCTEHLTGHAEFTMLGKLTPTLPCVQPPTMSYTYRSGCLTPLKFEIYYLGKVYRIVSFCTVIALVNIIRKISERIMFTALCTTSSMILYTYV